MYITVPSPECRAVTAWPAHYIFFWTRESSSSIAAWLLIHWLEYWLRSDIHGPLNIWLYFYKILLCLLWIFASLKLILERAAFDGKITFIFWRSKYYINIKSAGDFLPFFWRKNVLTFSCRTFFLDKRWGMNLLQCCGQNIPVAAAAGVTVFWPLLGTRRPAVTIRTLT